MVLSWPDLWLIQLAYIRFLIRSEPNIKVKGKIYFVFLESLVCLYGNKAEK